MAAQVSREKNSFWSSSRATGAISFSAKSLTVLRRISCSMDSSKSILSSALIGLPNLTKSAPRASSGRPRLEPPAWGGPAKGLYHSSMGTQHTSRMVWVGFSVRNSAFTGMPVTGLPCLSQPLKIVSTPSICTSICQ